MITIQFFFLLVYSKAELAIESTPRGIQTPLCIINFPILFPPFYQYSSKNFVGTSINIITTHSESYKSNGPQEVAEIQVLKLLITFPGQ